MTDKKELPMLNSERKEWVQKLRDADTKAQDAYNAALRFVNRIVLEADYLTTEQKTLILDSIWDK